MFSLFFRHTKNVDTGVKNVFFKLSFSSPMPPHLPNNSSCLCATLDTFTPPFQTFYKQPQTAVTKITFMFDKLQHLCQSNAFAYSHIHIFFVFVCLFYEPIKWVLSRTLFTCTYQHLQPYLYALYWPVCSCSSQLHLPALKKWVLFCCFFLSTVAQFNMHSTGQIHKCSIRSCYS